MASQHVASTRTKQLNNKAVQEGDYVLYWMQASQRAEDNHALEYAVQQANTLGQRLLVCFGLYAAYPEANWRHYQFMLEGLQETAKALKRRHIKFVLQLLPPEELAIELGQAASLVVCDRGYLRHQRAWREELAKQLPCQLVQVESDAIIPIECTSTKAEYAARTIRPKIHKQQDDFLVALRSTALEKHSLNLSVEGRELDDLESLLADLDIDRSVEPVAGFKGGTRQAKQQLRSFLDDSFADYASDRNQPHQPKVSYLSPYLHFGQLSPLYVALKVRESQTSQESQKSYLEELIVRRELAFNFVYYTPDYDSLSCLPDWAKKTLEAHKDDERQYLYTRQELEAAETHDPYWNAAMKAMKISGYLHNHMRMYWGKQLIAWTRSPEYAYKTALYLNNKYFLDGRDPSSYTNVAWLFGVHDRAWQEREVFGKLRIMTASGLERKTDPKAFVAQIEALAEA